MSLQVTTTEAVLPEWLPISAIDVDPTPYQPVECFQVTCADRSHELGGGGGGLWRGNIFYLLQVYLSILIIEEVEMEELDEREDCW
jgi:hypothetical protein